MLTPSEFLEYAPAKSTKITYKAALSRYLDIITEIPVPRHALDEAWETYLTNASDIGRDLQTFLNLCQTKHSYAPKTTHLYLQIILMYLKENDVTLPGKLIRACKNKIPKNRPITREAELTRRLLRKMLEHADIRTRAEILIAVSSGMRIGELVNFTIEDISFKTTPVEIRLKETITKTKTSRRVFISAEAAAALRQWLAVRTEITHGRGRSRDQSDTRCFPYSKNGEAARLKKLLKTCGLAETDPGTKRAVIHYHLFRKFFITEFKLAASDEVAEQLAGHEGYLSLSYRRLNEQELRTEYKKAESRLTIELNTTKKETKPEQKTEPCTSCIPAQKEMYNLKIENQPIIARIET